MTSANDTSPRVVQLPATLQNLANLSGLLERIERGQRAPNPAQYRQLVDHIVGELKLRSTDIALPELLACFPATAELYENLRYDVAGLCLSPLEQSVATEQAARQLLQTLSRRPAKPKQP